MTEPLEFKYENYQKAKDFIKSKGKLTEFLNKNLNATVEWHAMIAYANQLLTYGANEQQ